MPLALRLLLFYLVLSGLALVAYGPALGGGFLWDDTDWIRDNETLRTASGLWRIWFEPGAVIQYYPLTYTSWWLDYHLWDLSPTVMHVENVLLHAANALLFGLLLRRLGLPGAVFAALVFLVHPVHSESVAWLVERKNTLSAVFYLSACHLWLSHLDKPSRRTLVFTVVFYAAALLAKTATLMLPVTLLAIAIWHRREWRSALSGLVPFVAMSIGAAIVTIYMERGEGAVGHDFVLQMSERFALLGQAVGFYLSKLLLPVGLSFSYAKWEIAAGSALGWVPSMVLGVMLLMSAIAIFRMRRSIALACSLGLVVYVSHLLPVSGLVDYYYLRYAFAADHFQYLPSLGWIALLCCGGTYVLRGQHGAVQLGMAAAILGLFAFGTFHRAKIYTDVETLWRATVQAEPDAWLAQTNLGNLLARGGDPDLGIRHHRHAVAVYPDAFESINAIGNYLARRSEFAEAQEYFERALQIRPDDPLTYNNMGAMLGAAGRYQDALRCFDEGHARAPGNRDLLRNLAMVLSQAPDERVRNGARALRLASRLNSVADPSLLDEHVLFRSTLLGGDRAVAISLGERVLQRAQREGDQSLAQKVDRQLQRLKH